MTYLFLRGALPWHNDNDLRRFVVSFDFEEPRICGEDHGKCLFIELKHKFLGACFHSTLKPNSCPSSDNIRNAVFIICTETYYLIEFSKRGNTESRHSYWLIEPFPRVSRSLV